jgi:hypothetical protein
MILTSQGLNAESGRADDFYTQMRRIEYQAARLSTINLSVESTRTLIQEKSLDLMVGIVKYLNSALLYFNEAFFRMPLCMQLTIGNILKTIGEGSAVYEEGKGVLQSAINEYDQAVLDLAAAVIASNISFEISNR